MMLFLLIKRFGFIKLSFLLLFLTSSIILETTTAREGGGRIVSNIHVKLHNGRSYTITDDVSTVGELQLRLQRESGLDPQHQGYVLFGGKRLSPSDELHSVGVKDGSYLTFIPKRKKRNSTTIRSIDNNIKQQQQQQQQQQERMNSDLGYDAEKKTNTHSKNNSFDREVMKEQLFKDIASGNVLLMMVTRGSLSIDDGVIQFASLFIRIIKNPLFTEIMLNKDKVETMRKHMVSNPIFQAMINSTFPPTSHMKEVINDPTLYYESMLNGVQNLCNIDDDLLKEICSRSVRLMIMFMMKNNRNNHNENDGKNDNNNNNK